MTLKFAYGIKKKKKTLKISIIRHNPILTWWLFVPLCNQSKPKLLKLVGEMQSSQTFCCVDREGSDVPSWQLASRTALAGSMMAETFFFFFK